MSWLGRYQLGEFLRVVTQVTDAGGVPTWPATPPTLEVWLDGLRVLPPTAIPARDRTAVGLFEGLLFLDSRFVAAYGYSAVLKQPAPRRITTLVFDVLPGGDPAGAVIALFPLALPARDYLVFQTDGGILTRGKNPYLA